MGMVDRDEWFAINASAPPKGSLTKSGADATAMGAGGGFRVDPEAVPAVRAGFEEAIQEMQEAKRVARSMDQLRGGGVNPVVDKYMAAMIDRAAGEEGSVTMLADSAIAAYQSVIDQLDRALATYRENEATHVQTFNRQP